MVPEFSPAEQDSLYTLRTHTPQKLNERPLHMGAGYPDLWGCAQGHFQSMSKAGLEALAVSWGPGWLLECWFLPRGQAQPSPKASVPGSQPPSHRLELWCSYPNPEPSRPPCPSPASVSPGPRVGWAGWPAKKDRLRRRKESAGHLPRRCWRRDSSIPPGLHACPPLL